VLSRRDCQSWGIIDRDFQVETPKSHHPLKVKEMLEAKLSLLTLHIERGAYQSGRKRLNTRNYLTAQAVHLTLMQREPKNEGEESEREDSYHFL